MYIRQTTHTIITERNSLPVSQIDIELSKQVLLRGIPMLRLLIHTQESFFLNSWHLGERCNLPLPIATWKQSLDSDCHNQGFSQFQTFLRFLSAQRAIFIGPSKSSAGYNVSLSARLRATPDSDLRDHILQLSGILWMTEFSKMAKIQFRNWWFIVLKRFRSFAIWCTF